VGNDLACIRLLANALPPWRNAMAGKGWQDRWTTAAD